MRKYGRIDENHGQIVSALRQCGFSVQSLASIGNGVPDLLVGRNGRNHLFEVKVRGAKLTEDEEKFQQRWRGQVDTITSLEEALIILNRQAP